VLGAVQYRVRAVPHVQEQAMEKILDLTMLSGIFPTGYHGAYTAGVTSGFTVYVAGAGPVGLAAAHSAQLLGAAVVIVGDMIPERLKQAKSFGCETVDISEGDPKDQIEQILGVPEVDAAVDAVGFEARGHGADSEHEAPATVLNSIMDVTRVAGKLGIPGLYVTGDPGAADDAAKVGSLSIRIGLGWAKSRSFTTGQCPVMKYHNGLMQMILNDLTGRGARARRGIRTRAGAVHGVAYTGRRAGAQQLPSTSQVSPPAITGTGSRRSHP
jgi:glutathione-independent formaldehyde dehydrogenase